MESIRKQDPTFTNYVPTTAAEAVGRYVRCRKNGLKPMLVPECLIACAAALEGEELDNFERWIINPNADLSKLDLVPANTIRKANEAVYQEAVSRFIEEQAPRYTPPLPAEDEKMQQEDEKMPELTLRLKEAIQGSLDLSPAARCSTPAT